MGLWLGGSLHLSLSFCLLIMSPTNFSFLVSTQPFSTVHVKNGSGKEADGIGGQLLIWFGSLVASWDTLQRKVELKGVLLLGQFAHKLFWLNFMLNLAMRAEYFDGTLTWRFSSLEPILLPSHYEPYKMDKVFIYCHGFLFHMGFSCWQKWNIFMSFNKYLW